MIDFKKKGGGATVALDNLASTQINSSLIPDTNRLHNLGSLSKYWQRVFAESLALSSYATVGPTSAGSDNGGFFWDVATNALHIRTLAGGFGQTPDIRFTLPSGSEIIFGRQIRPLTDSNINLGTSNYYWANSYFDKLYLNATATLDGSVAGVITGIGNLYLTGACKFGDGGTTNYTEIKADGEINMHGTARVIRHLRIGAGSLKLGSSSPTAGLTGIFPHLSFSNVTEQEGHYQVLVPSRWDDTTDIEICFTWLYIGAQDDGTVKWGLEYNSKQAGEDPTAGSVTISSASAGNHTTGEMVRTCIATKILASNLSHEDTFGMRIFRDAANDTLGTGAKLLSIHFEFKMSKLGKAT